MGRRKQRGRPVNGILVVDKPAGITSNDTLQKAKYLFYAAKAGHTGSLDPMATGVLPICFGEATKFTQFLLDADKCYLSTFRLGVTTTTGDAEGEVIETRSAAGIDAARVEDAMAAFEGDILQVPPMYSALKKDGVPLYKLAREGIEVERQARPVTIFSYQLLAFRAGEVAEADVEIRCSKGTYVRTLAEDLGAALGCGGHVSRLHRSAAGCFTDADAISLDALTALREGRRGEDLDHLLKPVDTAVAHLMAVDLPESMAWYFRRGQPVMAAKAYREAREGDIVRIFESGAFIGVGEVLEDGRLAPKRLVVDDNPS
ncbi:MAG: tRNA pseudouridine(55) synthase TruB [Porticoccaceae bacterium]|nr:tRNA pseudouridine(55) synthase TruB [Porticoccaceae bacterium]MEA3298767.1 tRNA pseudouridine(55) synthase TruB [Pseudomonadota bacterium]HLS99081.1 tRNA pseudouridine(55) synthase TruB [Porticoccaceae bacterium]